MNGSLGRDRVWNEHIWSEIDKAVREEVGRVRVAQKVFPSTVVNNVLAVPANRIVPFGHEEEPAPGGDIFQPLFEISKEFTLTQAQVDGEENLRLAPSLARLAASKVANAEDAILFLGQRGIPTGVHVTNQPSHGLPPQFSAIPPGFVAEAANYGPPTNVKDSGPHVLGNILAAVADGMAALDSRDQPGPYALFLSPERYAQTFGPVRAGELRTPGDKINHIVTGGFYMVNSLAVKRLSELSAPATDIGVLLSLGGEPTKIVIGTDATTAFTSTDAKGDHHFRVFERIQMVVQDGRAFQTLEFAASSATK